MIIKLLIFSQLKIFVKKFIPSALAGWLSWLKQGPIHQNAVGSIPSQVTYLGCGFDPWWGHVWEATDQCFSLTLMFLFLSLSNQ